MRMKGTDEVFAMKMLNKWEMLKRAEVRFNCCKNTIIAISSNNNIHCEA